MFVVVAACVLMSGALCDDLVSVAVIYRHGDRTPIQPYPTDPYRNASYWPVGFGQLTNLGKMQHYLLGKWLRDRYDGFLPSRYSEKDIYVRSSDADRTLMSAEANLAGLYPPESDQIWNPSMPWQPIPIHTTPLTEDNLVSMKKSCPKYDLLLNRLFKTEFFVNISRTNHDLYVYLTKNSGSQVASLENVEYLYNTLYIETVYNLTLPDWTRAVYPKKMKPWAELSFAVPTYNQDLARLKAGTLFNEIIQNFVNATTGRDFMKFAVFSAHDINIANILNAMGAFQYHCPPYTSSILFELYKDQTDFYVKTYYKNSSILQTVTLKGCDFKCNLNDFIDILSPIVLTRSEWEIECQLEWYYHFRLDLQYIVYISAGLSFLIFTLSISLVFKWCQKRPKGGDALYTQLPSDEVA